MSYFSELCEAMKLLASQPNTIFLGQGVGEKGTTMSATFDGVVSDRRMEMPVAEDMQAGIAIGMSLQGYLPICVYPRWNFLICAANQIVNHLDRLPLYSDYRPKVIIRVAVPSTVPFNPGPQHDDDFTTAFGMMLRATDILRLEAASDIVPAYQWALSSPRSSIIVEYTTHYKDQRGKGG
jgi:pyruvate/2-oxoglutarate/acetoin dehydrogenase E1 component